MTAGTRSERPLFESHLPGRLLTWEDLQTVPDDEHHRYEIIEGALLVSPSPDYGHQIVVFALARLLHQARPADLSVLPAPFDFVPVPTVSVQPDVLVVRRLPREAKRTERPPLLVVEVVAPGSRAIVQTVKRALYEEHAVPAYWIVDPDVPSLLALHLVNGRYVEAAHVTGEQVYDAELPFPVRVVPARLLDDLSGDGPVS